MEKRNVDLKIFILTMLFITLTTGCVSIKTSLYGNVSQLPTDPRKVQILRNLPPNESTYEKIGELFISETADDFDSDSLLHNRLKRRVAKLGADAVVIWQEDTGDFHLMLPGTATTTTSTSGNVFGSATSFAPGHATGMGTISTESTAQTTYQPPQNFLIPVHVMRGVMIRYKAEK